MSDAGGVDGDALMTVDEYTHKFLDKFLAVRHPSSSLPPRVVSPKKKTHARATPLPQGDYADPSGAPEARADQNLRRASERLTDLLRKTSVDRDLLKVPLRCVRDRALVVSDPEADALLSLLEGVHHICTRMQSRGAPGPYHTVERALRLRLFLCVAGESWAERPALRAKALERLWRFAREEAAAEKEEEEDATDHPRTSPARTTSVTSKPAASAPVLLPATRATNPSDRAASPARRTISRSSASSALASVLRRAPAAMHGMVDVSSWRATLSELAKVPASKMLPVTFHLLGEVHEARARVTFALHPDAVPVPVASASREAASASASASTTTTTAAATAIAAASASTASDGSASAPIVTPTRRGTNADASALDDLPDGWHRFDAPPSSGETADGASPDANEGVIEAARAPTTKVASEVSPNTTLNPFAPPPANLTRAEFEETMRALADA